MIVKLFKIKYKDLLLYLLCMLAGFFIGLTIQLINGNEKCMLISILAGALCAICFNYLFAPFSFENNLRICIQAGATRKELYFAELMLETVKCLAVVIFASVSYIIQKKIYGKSGKEVYIIKGMEERYINLKNILFLMCLIVISTMFISALITRYTTKALVAIWIIAMMICVVPEGITNAMDKRPDSIIAKFGFYIVKQLAKLNMTRIYLMVGIVMALCFGISFILVKNKEY